MNQLCVVDAGALVLLGAAACGSLETSKNAAPGGLTTSTLPPRFKGPSNNAGVPVAPKKTTNVRGPIPTNDDHPSLVFQRYSDNPYSTTTHANPLAVQAEADGLGVSHPKTYVITPDACKYEYTHTEDFTLGVAGLSSSDAKLDGYSDWTVSAYQRGGGLSLRATFGHGLPFVYATKTSGDAQVSAVGMNWGDGGSYSAWFTAELEKIQGINSLPIQPGSTYLRPFLSR